MSDDADTAELMGIDNRKLYALAFAIAMIFTAIAGVLFAIRTIFSYTGIKRQPQTESLCRVARPPFVSICSAMLDARV